MFIDSDVSGRSLDPASGIEVFDTVLDEMHGLMCMSAEDPLRIVSAGMGKRAGGDFRCVPTPAGVEAVEKFGEALLTKIEFLQHQERS